MLYVRWNYRHNQEYGKKNRAILKRKCAQHHRPPPSPGTSPKRKMSGGPACLCRRRSPLSLVKLLNHPPLIPTSSALHSPPESIKYIFKSQIKDSVLTTEPKRMAVDRAVAWAPPCHCRPSALQLWQNAKLLRLPWWWGANPTCSTTANRENSQREPNEVLQSQNLRLKHRWRVGGSLHDMHF